MNNIKELQPKEGVTLLAVKVPDDSEILDITYNKDRSWLRYTTEFSKGFRHLCNIELPDGNWQLLGTPDQITEEVWNGIVKPYVRLESWCNNTDLPKVEELTPKESGMCFLASNEVYTVNPYGERPCQLHPLTWESESYEKDLELWNKAEANTGAWVILLRV